MNPSITRMPESTEPETVCGIPVNTQKLIVNLENYRQTKEKNVVWTLRLCNRLGRDAPVAKLPTELIDMIENELPKEARKISYDGFEKDLACFEDRCDPRTEVNDAQEILELSAHRRFFCDNCFVSPEAFPPDPEYCSCVLHRHLTHEELVAQALFNHRKYMHAPLCNRMDYWFEDVFRYDFGKLLFEDFRLAARMIRCPLTKASAKALAEHTQAKYHAPHEWTTICYLTRPWLIPMSDRELTKRAAKAMEILGLEPFFDPGLGRYA